MNLRKLRIHVFDYNEKAKHVLLAQGFVEEGKLRRDFYREGVFHASVDRDAHVAKGATIGFVTDYLNRPLQNITSPEAGIVMFIRAVPSLKKGDTIASIGVVKK